MARMPPRKVVQQHLRSAELLLWTVAKMKIWGNRSHFHSPLQCSNTRAGNCQKSQPCLASAKHSWKALLKAQFLVLYLAQKTCYTNWFSSWRFFIWNVALAISCSTTNEKFYSSSTISESTCFVLRSSVNRKVSLATYYFPILICQDDAGTLFTNSISGKCTALYLWSKKATIGEGNFSTNKSNWRKSFPLSRNWCLKKVLVKTSGENE